RRVRDHVDVRVLDRVEDALGQLGTRLAARDVERSDDQVERREQLVWIVELAVGADLELAAVQQAEALLVRLGRRRPSLLLRGEDAELTAFVRGDDLAGLVDPGEAVLAQAPALVAGHRPEPDVVLLRAGEVDEVGAGLARAHDHEVDLWAAATEADRRLVQAAADDRLDRGQTAEHLDDVVRVVGLRQEIEVTDRFPPPAVRAGGHDASQVEHVEEAFRDLVNEHLGLVEEQPPLAALEPGDALEDQLLGALRETLQAANPAALGRHPELLDRLYPEVAVDQSNGLRPDA